MSPSPPLFANKTLPFSNSYWGRPDITPGLIGLNTALNLVNSCANRVLKIFGGPILWGVGFAESSIAVQPGRIMNLGDLQGKIDAVKIASDIPSAIQFAADLRSDIDELSHVPGVATGRIATMPRGNLSGVAIELLFMPLLKKTDTKQCTRSEEHTSELQSPDHLVCRLLLEKKKRRQRRNDAREV